VLIALDFDDVLMGPARLEAGYKMGRPLPGALEGVRALIGRGHTVVVHTVRGDRPEHVQEWLAYFDFPPLPVTNIKPRADVYVDNRAIRFLDWDQTLTALGAEPTEMFTRMITEACH
jgi:hypothetical protein